MHWEGIGCCGACQVTAEGKGVPDSSELAPSLAGVSAFRCGVGVFRRGFHPFLWLSEFGSVMYTCVHPCFPHPLAPDPPGAVREGLLFPGVGGQAEPLGLESAPPGGGEFVSAVGCLPPGGFNIRGIHSQVGCPPQHESGDWEARLLTGSGGA